MEEWLCPGNSVRGAAGGLRGEPANPGGAGGGGEGASEEEGSLEAHPESCGGFSQAESRRRARRQKSIHLKRREGGAGGGAGSRAGWAACVLAA